MERRRLQACLIAPSEVEMRWPGASERPLGNPIRDAVANGEVHSYSNEANHPTLPHNHRPHSAFFATLPTITVRAASRLYG